LHNGGDDLLYEIKRCKDENACATYQQFAAAFERTERRRRRIQQTIKIRQNKTNKKERETHAVRTSCLRLRLKVRNAATGALSKNGIQAPISNIAAVTAQWAMYSCNVWFVARQHNIDAMKNTKRNNKTTKRKKTLTFPTSSFSLLQMSIGSMPPPTIVRSACACRPATAARKSEPTTTSVSV
jgi:hypothetical protein